MDSDGKSGMNWANGSVIVTALAAMGLYYIHHDAPLLDLRPTDQVIQEQQFPQQTIDARLWQDPLVAVQKSLDKTTRRQLAEQCGDIYGDNRHCRSPLVGASAPTLVIGVTISGAPYPEDAEQRRRTRYAVLAGLERSGFVPNDARHIDYFWWKQEPAPPPRLMEPALLVAQHTPPSTFPDFFEQGLDRNKISKIAGRPLSPLLTSTVPSQGQEPIIMSALGSPAPFEWFEEAPRQSFAHNRQSGRRILVLWLDEEILKNQPLRKIAELEDSLGLKQGQVLKIIGPYTSDILQDIVWEEGLSRGASKNALNFASEQDVHPRLFNGQFYVYGASVPNSQLAVPLMEPTIFQNANTDKEVFDQKSPIKLQRTISNDDTLADGIVTELKYRNSRIGPDKEEGDLALISEWDTYYGQTLPKAVETQFARHKAKCNDGTNCWIHKITYLRGLDGLLPNTDAAKERKQDKEASQDQRQGGGELLKTESDTKNLDRPIGQGQFDYLRRMSKDLHRTDEELRKNGRKLQAIGILGSDVFDKLLVLRALRPEFPEALFFTTDFDEAYTVASELPWTRNLIIASSFGQRLHEKLQREIPSFRSTYQSSAFLATRLAIGDPRTGWKTPDDVSQSITGQLSTPRIFEITRSGGVLTLGGHNALTAAPPSNCQENRDLWYCDLAQVQPDPGDAKPFPTFEDTARILLACGLAVGAAFGWALLHFQRVPKGARVEVWLIVAGLGIGALMCAFWEEFAEFVTGYGRGEPILMLDGVSVWPTVILRILGTILCVYFIWRAQNGLQKNLAAIADEFGLNAWPDSAVVCERSLTTTIKDIFDFSLGSEPMLEEKEKATGRVRLNFETTWRAYVAQEQFRSRRFWRAGAYTVVMFLIFLFVLRPLFGYPSNPARGAFASGAYFDVSCTFVVFMLFLTFYVFDATCFCLLFVNMLRRDEIKWPERTISRFQKRMLLQPQMIDDWIELEFVAQRTRCIGGLIYYPFGLIALLLISRSSVFANYAPSLTILVANGISLLVVFGCAFMLWRSATAARDVVKRKLMDKVVRAKSAWVVRTSGDKNPLNAAQLETLLSRVEQLKDGAFGPLTKQPLIRAVIFPLGSFGWTVLIEKGIIPGL